MTAAANCATPPCDRRVMAVVPSRSQLLLRISQAIVRRGFAVVPVGPDTCAEPSCSCSLHADGWTYTIGMAEAGHPEVIVVGLAPEHAAVLAGWVFDRHLARDPLPIGEPAVFAGIPLKAVRVPPSWVAADPSRLALWFAHYAPGRRRLPAPPVVQLLWGDDAGRFPDDPACDVHVRSGQAVLAADPGRFRRSVRGHRHSRAA